jgi:hypothetical protein
MLDDRAGESRRRTYVIIHHRSTIEPENLAVGLSSSSIGHHSIHHV